MASKVCFRNFVLLLVIALVFGDHCPLGGQLSGHYCGRGGSRCPDNYYCEISPVDAYAVCCPKPVQTTPCTNGKQPLKNEFGNNVYCGLGGTHCPATYHCAIAPNDAYAVCCPL